MKTFNQTELKLIKTNALLHTIKNYVELFYCVNTSKSIISFYENDKILNIDEYDFYVLTEEERAETSKEIILNNLHFFSPGFLEEISEIPAEIFKAIQDSFFDEGSALIEKLITITCGIDTLISESIKADSYGHFLSYYDGTEYKYTHHYNNNTEFLNLYIYRLN